MRLLRWNLCTTFAAIGAAIAYVILLGLFGFHWQLIAGGIAGLIAAYVVSTALGVLALRMQLGRYAASSIIVGAGFAWLTLLAGILAISVTTFSMEVVRALIRAPSGQPMLNVLAEITIGLAIDFIGKPLTVGLVFGFVPSGILGAVYGMVLRSRFNPALVGTPIARRGVIIAAGITLLIPLMFALTIIQAPNTSPTTSVSYADVPIALRECGEIPISKGVLAYCMGSPCASGECQWGTEQDAFALLVQPPEGSAWQWNGGGIGTGRAPNIIKHNVFWVRPEPDDSLDESSPRRHASYDMVFNGSVITIGAQEFQYVPGMLMRLQFAEDWSVTASVTEDAQQVSGANIGDLQQALNRACANIAHCRKPFRILSEAGQ